jgi:hypothetical protein
VLAQPPASPFPSSNPPPREARRKPMSDEAIAIVITIAIIALFLVWVPFLNLICPPCGRLLDRLRLPKDKIKKQPTVLQFNARRPNSKIGSL